MVLYVNTLENFWKDTCQLDTFVTSGEESESQGETIVLILLLRVFVVKMCIVNLKIIKKAIRIIV